MGWWGQGSLEQQSPEDGARPRPLPTHPSTLPITWPRPPPPLCPALGGSQSPRPGGLGGGSPRGHRGPRSPAMSPSSLLVPVLAYAALQGQPDPSRRTSPPAWWFPEQNIRGPSPPADTSSPRAFHSSRLPTRLMTVESAAPILQVGTLRWRGEALAALEGVCPLSPRSSGMAR